MIVCWVGCVVFFLVGSAALLAASAGISPAAERLRVPKARPPLLSELIEPPGKPYQLPHDARPVASAPPDPCFQIFFVHTEKTGGVTARTLFERFGPMQGIAVYPQGSLKYSKRHGRLVAPDMTTPCNGTISWYGPQSCSLQRLLADLEADPTSHRRLFVELRGSRLIDEGYPVLKRLVALRKRPSKCKVYIFTILREPKAMYSSFYRYFVAKHQRKDPTRYGATFADWIPVDMQSQILCGINVGFNPVYNRQGTRIPRSGFLPAIVNESKHDAVRARYSPQLAQDILYQMDLVATTEHIDVALLKLADTVGLRNIVYKPLNVRKSRDSRDLSIVDLSLLVSNASAPASNRNAPTIDEVRLLIEEHTPNDRFLYEEAREAMEALSSEQSFGLRLRNYREVLQDFAAFGKLRRDVQTIEL